MKNSLLGGILLGVLVGAASAGLTTTLILGSGSADDATSDAGVLAPDLDSTFAAELDQLRAENDDLRKRIVLLEMAPPPTEREPAVAAESRDAFESEVREWMASMQKPPVKVPDLKIGVEEALSSIREDERRAKATQMEARRLEITEKRLAQLSARLGLNSAQEDDMRTLWRARDDRFRELKTNWEAGTSSVEDAGLTKRSIQEEYEVGLQTILSPVQLETLRTMETDK